DVSSRAAAALDFAAHRRGSSVMRHHIAATIAIALCAGCQRDAGDGVPAARPAGDLQPAAAPGGVFHPPPPAAAPEPSSAAAPPLVLRWECDGGAVLTTKYLPRDEA